MSCVAVAVLAAAAQSLLDPAKTPPMGWRSWNAFLDAIDHGVISAQVDAMAASPLLALGYGRIGIDGGWVCQNPPSKLWCTCGGVGGSYHNATGDPVVGLGRFPNLTALAAHAHSRGVKLDFYGNSCNCAAEEQKVWSARGGNPEKDVAAVFSYGMDGIKVDGCSPAHNITRWANALAKPGNGRPMLLENCGCNGVHWSPPPVSAVSGTGPCGFQMYRVSSDIAPQFYSTMANLQAAVAYANVSRPGCWAYPDMLQVGSSRLSPDETATHFAAWCVSSSPLVLGYDLTNASAKARAEPYVTSKGAVAVSQAWHGHAGQPVATSAETFTAFAETGAAGVHGRNVTLPVWQVWAKPMRDDGMCVAVLLINLSPSQRDVAVTTGNLGWTHSGSEPAVTDVWTGESAGAMKGGVFAANALAPHASRFVIIDASA